MSGEPDMTILNRRMDAVRAAAGVCDTETAQLLGRACAVFELTNGLPHDTPMVFSTMPNGDTSVVCTLPDGRKYGYGKRKEGVAK